MRLERGERHGERARQVGLVELVLWPDIEKHDISSSHPCQQGVPVDGVETVSEAGRHESRRGHEYRRQRVMAAGSPVRNWPSKASEHSR